MGVTEEDFEGAFLVSGLHNGFTDENGFWRMTLVRRIHIVRTASRLVPRMGIRMGAAEACPACASAATGAGEPVEGKTLRWRWG
ncbi:MAG: hypothetical protein Fur0017_08990 [Anaerolineales bacterium]